MASNLKLRPRILQLNWAENLPVLFLDVYSSQRPCGVQQRERACAEVGTDCCSSFGGDTNWRMGQGVPASRPGLGSDYPM